MVDWGGSTSAHDSTRIDYNKCFAFTFNDVKENVEPITLQYYIFSFFILHPSFCMWRVLKALIHAYI